MAGKVRRCHVASLGFHSLLEAWIMTAANLRESTKTSSVLYLAFELSEGKWKLAFTVGLGQKPRIVQLPARDLAAVGQAIAKAKQRFCLPTTAPVVSCYEAGRDGFWLHRALAPAQVTNFVVDSASIEVNRRQRRAKSDRLDAVKLVTMLLRYHQLGERKVWSVVRVPHPATEAARQLHREAETLRHAATEHSNRIKGLLVTLGVAVKVDARFLERLPTLRQHGGAPLPVELQERLRREYARWQLVQAQQRALTQSQRRQLRDDATVDVDKMRQLLGRSAIGVKGAWMLVREFFWRRFDNRRQVGSLAGLTATPYGSGGATREQGISKAGNRRVRWLLVELAWGWLRWQPHSELTQWYQKRFADGNRRSRRIGIVALARKLLVALWRLLEHGEVPAGAATVDWRRKINGGRLPAKLATAS
jgi:transposase